MRSASSTDPRPLPSIPRRMVPVAPRLPRPKTSSFSVSGAIDDITALIKRLSVDPIALVIGLITISFFVSAGPALTQGPIGAYLQSSNNTISAWMIANPTKVYGLMAFAPSLYVIPAAYTYVATAAVVAWVFIIPQSSVYEYLIQSLAVMCYFKTSLSNTRLFLTLVTVGAYWLGYIIISPPGVHSFVCSCYDSFGRCSVGCASMSQCYDSAHNSIPCV